MTNLYESLVIHNTLLVKNVFVSRKIMLSAIKTLKRHTSMNISYMYDILEIYLHINKYMF